MRSESSIQAACVALAEREFGVESVKVYRKTGWPDYVFFVPGGRPLIPEFKNSRGGKDEPLQPFVQARLRAKGYNVIKCSSVSEFRTALVEAIRLHEEKRQVAPREGRRGALLRPRPR